MSLVFNDTTNFRGLVQEYEKEIGANRGDISGVTNKLKDFAAAANLAFDDFFAIAIQASGEWQIDDSNHTDYPIITTNLVASQRDYSFTVDENSNLILDIYKVMVADANGVFREIQPVDQQSDKDMESFYSGQNATGTPTRYDKTANGIFLDVIPSYNYTGGLKVFVNREPSYFAYNDTTKKPGVPGLLHRYFAVKPAWDYARRNSLAILTTLFAEVQRLEAMISSHFGRRNKDIPRRMRANVEDNH